MKYKYVESLSIDQRCQFLFWHVSPAHSMRSVASLLRTLIFILTALTFTLYCKTPRGHHLSSEQRRLYFDLLVYNLKKVPSYQY